MLPILYQSPELVLYSYPLLMGIGWGVAYQIYFSLQPSGVSKFRAHFLFWGIFLSAWIGAKLLFYITYPENLNKNFLQQVNFWTGGGFVFYGGFLGAFLFLGLYKAFDKNLKFKALWPMLPALAFGHGLGRIGCFLAGCCFGKPTDLFWGVYLHDHYRHPTQLIEAFGLLVLGIYVIKSTASKFLLVARYLIGYGILRFLVEGLRGDAIRGSWGLFTPSQWISVGLILTGLFLIYLNKSRKLAVSEPF